MILERRKLRFFHLKTRTLSHFNLAELVVCHDVIVLVADVFVLGHPYVLHFASRIPFRRKPLVWLTADLIPTHRYRRFYNV